MSTYASGSGGYSGKSYDRWVEQQHGNSTLSKVQHQYWVTKQTVFRKLGKKEDECIIASDAELDAKLELFKSIDETCCELQKVLDKYQEKLCILSQEENGMGRFLKEYGKADDTRAGKMMIAVGKTMSYSGQQRLALRVPLVRLYQEVETFRNRAIEDTLITVNNMEKIRNEYRASLKWMKNVSQELDPDTYKQLERFREVQGLVRKNKAQFDKLKLDCLQKVDLLAASRCNMFSHSLILYQNTLSVFCQKTAKTMSSVSERFKGYQHFRFSVVKELSEPSKKLSEQTKQKQEEEENDADKMIFFDEYQDEKIDETKDLDIEDKGLDKDKTWGSLENFLDLLQAPQSDKKMGDKDAKEQSKATQKKNLESIKSDPCSFPVDLLTNNSDLPDTQQDTFALMNNVVNMSSSDTKKSDFGTEWDKVFGPALSIQQMTDYTEGKEIDVEKTPAFLPSQLLGMNQQFLSVHDDIPVLDAGPISPQKTTKPLDVPEMPVTQPQKISPTNQIKGQDISRWFNLFADLDPLSNPDNIGKKGEDSSNRYC